MILTWMKDSSAALIPAEDSMLIRFHDWLASPAKQMNQGKEI